MNVGELIYWGVELCMGVYILGVGLKFFPDPGVEEGEKTNDFIDRFRMLFVIGGISLILHLAITMYRQLSG